MTMQREHGRATYNKGCRCRFCVESCKLYMRRYRARKKASHSYS